MSLREAFFSTLIRLGNRQGLLLDVGCGEARFLLDVSKFLENFLLIGLDVDLLSIQRAWRRLRLMKMATKACLISSSAHSLPFRDEVFDLVTAVMLFHEFRPAAKLIDFVVEARRVLKDDGLLVVIDKFKYTPHDSAEASSLRLEEIYHEALSLAHNLDIWGLHEVEDYTRLLAKAGMKVISVVISGPGEYLDYEEFIRRIRGSVRDTIQKVKDPRQRALLFRRYTEALNNIRIHGYRRSRVLMIQAKKTSS